MMMLLGIALLSNTVEGGRRRARDDDRGYNPEKAERLYD